MKQRQDNSAAWNAILQDCVNDPTVQKPIPSRPRKNTSGWITPSTPESVAACDKYLADMYANIAHQRTVNENIQNHNATKKHRRELSLKEAERNHTVETWRRAAKYGVKKSDRGWLVTVPVIVFACSILGAVLVNYVP